MDKNKKYRIRKTFLINHNKLTGWYFYIQRKRWFGWYRVTDPYDRTWYLKTEQECVDIINNMLYEKKI